MSRTGRTRTDRTGIDLGEVFAEVLGAYLLDLERKGLRPSSILKYRFQLVAFAEWIHPAEIVGVDREVIDRFLDGRQLVPKTRYAWISALHMFFEWAVMNGRAVEDPTLRIPRPRSPRLVPRPIRDEDLADAMVEAPADVKAMLVLAAYQGLRCGEIATLDRDDLLDRNNPPVMIVVDGKGGHQRVLPLHPATMPALRVAGLPRAGWVFTRPNSTYRLHGWQVSQIVGRYLHSMGIDASAHQLRHWFGTKTYQASRDLRAVQHLMGHASPTTTAGYAAYSTEGARAAVESLEATR